MHTQTTMSFWKPKKRLLILCFGTQKTIILSTKILTKIRQTSTLITIRGFVVQKDQMNSPTFHWTNLRIVVLTLSACEAPLWRPLLCGCRPWEPDGNDQTSLSQSPKLNELNIDGNWSIGLPIRSTRLPAMVAVRLFQSKALLRPIPSELWEWGLKMNFAEFKGILAPKPAMTVFCSQQLDCNSLSATLDITLYKTHGPWCQAGQLICITCANFNDVRACKALCIMPGWLLILMHYIQYVRWSWSTMQVHFRNT